MNYIIWTSENIVFALISVQINVILVCFFYFVFLLLCLFLLLFNVSLSSFFLSKVCVCFWLPHTFLAKWLFLSVLKACPHFSGKLLCFPPPHTTLFSPPIICPLLKSTYKACSSISGPMRSMPHTFRSPESLPPTFQSTHTPL